MRQKQQLHSQHHSLQKDAEMAARLQDDFGGSNKAAVESEFKRFQEERASELLAKELEQTEEAEATQEVLVGPSTPGDSFALVPQICTR